MKELISRGRKPSGAGNTVRCWEQAGANISKGRPAGWQLRNPATSAPAHQPPFTSVPHPIEKCVWAQLEGSFFPHFSSCFHFLPRETSMIVIVGCSFLYCMPATVPSSLFINNAFNPHSYLIEVRWSHFRGGKTKPQTSEVTYTTSVLVSIATVTKDQKPSGLKQHVFIYSHRSAGQKSKISLTRVKSRFWQGCSFWWLWGQFVSSAFFSF